MDRLVQHNVLAMSGRAVEAAGDVHTLLLDKTGTITLGNRQATEFAAAAGRRPTRELADAAQLAVAGRRDARGRSIVVLAKERYGIRGRDLADTRRRVRAVHRARRACQASTSTGARSAKGAADAIESYVAAQRRQPCRPELAGIVDRIAAIGRHAARRRRTDAARSASST